MYREAMQPIEFVYKPAFEGKTMNWVAFSNEWAVWDWIKQDTAFGLECEYTHTKTQLKKKGYSVIKYKLVEAQ